MNLFTLIIAPDLSAWQHAAEGMLADGRFAAWVVGDPRATAPVHESFTTEAAARAAYPDLPPLGRFAGQDDLPPVPAVVRAAALRYVLNGQGLRATVEAAVAAADQNTKDAWEFETNIRRDHPLIAAFSAALGLTTEQVDAIFRAAADL